MGVPLRTSSLPSLRAAFSVEDGENDNSMLFEHEENLIGKSPDQCTAEVPVHHRKPLGTAEDGVKGGVNVKQKVRPESGDSLLIPVEGFAHFRLGLGTDKQLVLHLRPLIRSRTISQGDPLPGSL